MRIGWPCHYWNHPCPTSYSLDEQQRPFFGLATHLTKLVVITWYIWGKEQIDEIIILFHIVWSEVQPSICALLILNLWCFLSLKPKTFIKYLNSSINWRVLLSNRAASSEILMDYWFTCRQHLDVGGDDCSASSPPGKLLWSWQRLLPGISPRSWLISAADRKLTFPQWHPAVGATSQSWVVFSEETSIQPENKTKTLLGAMLKLLEWMCLIFGWNVAFIEPFMATLRKLSQQFCFQAHLCLKISLTGCWSFEETVKF